MVGGDGAKFLVLDGVDTFESSKEPFTVSGFCRLEKDAVEGSTLDCILAARESREEMNLDRKTSEERIDVMINPVPLVL